MLHNGSAVGCRLDGGACVVIRRQRPP